MSPADENRLYAATGNSTTVFSSTDAGASWFAQRSADERNPDGWVIASMAGSDVDRGMFYLSKPITPHPTEPMTALSNGWSSLIVKTTNGGRDWRYSNTGFVGISSWTAGLGAYSSFSFDPKNPARRLMCPADYGAFLSEDNEQTFRLIHWGNCSSAALVPGTNTAVVTGGTWREKSLFVSRNIHAPVPTWSEIPDSLQQSWAAYSFIAAHPQHPEVVYADLFRFDDIARSDQPVRLPRVAHAMFLGNGDTIYHFKGTDATHTTIFRSDNRGGTWTSTTFGDPSRSYSIIPHSAANIKQVAVHPTDRDIIYLAIKGSGVGIVRHDAFSLKNTAQGLPGGRYGVEPVGVAVDQTDPDVLYVGYGNDLHYRDEIFRSTNGGDSWSDLRSMTGGAVFVSPHDRYVYATGGFGTWKFPPPGWVVPDAGLWDGGIQAQGGGESDGGAGSEDGGSNGTDGGGPLLAKATARRVSAAVALDGRLEETDWGGGLEHQIHRQVVGGPGIPAGTGSFTALWDDQYAYVAVSIVDDKLFTDSSFPSDDDGVEIYIDTDNNQSPTYDTKDYHYIFKLDSTVAFEQRGKLENVRYGWSRSATGYNLEVAIPWSTLKMSPSPGTVMGFDVALNDDDDGNGRESQAMWAGTASNWQSTVSFGALTLVDEGPLTLPADGGPSGGSDAGTSATPPAGCGCTSQGGLGLGLAAALVLMAFRRGRSTELVEPCSAKGRPR